jgi:hypothetical protein
MRKTFIGRALLFGGLLSLGVIAANEIASAQCRGPFCGPPPGNGGGNTSPAPAPLIGFGLPLAAGAVAAALAARRYRRKS